ncbi:NfeD family protein [Methanosphaerula subterraneus]|uniref:NfeD family protein n=1 Tax=Methanosphaerula subterraneus TaxID=3350244 RepID=UPI003F864A09
MVLFGGVDLGWILIVVGALVLLAEAYTPGFFLTVPGTVMVLLGALLLLGVDIFNSEWGIVAGVVGALAAAVVTVLLYSRITPDERPTTALSRDSFAGRTGVVTRVVDTVNFDGKVDIEGNTWSAISETGTIPVGTRVRVVRSEGVHIIVKEITHDGTT